MSARTGVDRASLSGVVLAAALGASWLLFLGGGWSGIYDVRLRVITLAAAVAILGAWIVTAVIRPFWRPRTVMWPALAVVLVSMTVSVVASSRPRLGLDYVAYAVILAGLYLVLQRMLASPRLGARVVSLAVPLFLTVSLLYVAVVISQWVAWWSLVGGLTAVPLRPGFASLAFGNPSAVLTVTTTLLATTLAVLGTGTPWRRAAAGAAVALLLVVALMSGSRAGWFALAIGAAVVGTLSLGMARNRGAVGQLLSAPRVGRSLVVALVGGLAVAVVLAPGILGRIFQGGEELRAQFYLVSLRMFQSAPLTGTGPGTWAPLRSTFTAAGETDYVVPHAHSVLFQTAAELGTVGLLAGLVVIGCVGLLIRDAIRDPDPGRRRFGWATLFAGSYLAVHQLLDFYPNMPAVLFAFALPVAWLDATARKPLIRLPTGPVLRAWRTRTAAAAGLVFALILSAGWLARSEAAALEMDRGVALAGAGHWTDALPRFRAAAAADPDLAPYQLALGVAAANAGDLRAAADAFEQVTRTDDLPEAWLNLAAVRRQAGDAAAADDALAHALRLGEQQAVVNLDVGALRLASGDPAGAVHEFAAALALMPSLAGDPWWVATPDRRAIWPQVFDAAVARLGPDAPESAVNLAISARRFDLAGELIARITDSETRSMLTEVVRAWQGDATAGAALRARASAHPLDVTVAGWCARVAVANGRPAEAERYWEWVRVLSDGPAFSIDPIGIVDGPAATPDVQRLPATTTLFWGHYGYRRPAPWDQVIGALPHLVFE